MKKTSAIFLMVMFLVSLVPFSFAEEGPGIVRDKKEDLRDAKEDIRDKRENAKDRAEDVRDTANVDRKKCIDSCTAQGQTNCEARCKIADKKEDVRDAKEDAKDIRENVRDRLEDTRENTREKNRERLAKIQGLDQRQIERLSSLNVKNVEKIEGLKKERLDRLAKLSEKKLERIAELDKEKLEKVSDLTQPELEKLSILGRGRIKEIAEKDPARMKAELKALKIVKVKEAKDLARREIPAASLERAKQRFENAKEKFNEAKETLKEERDAFKEAKENEDDAAILEHSKNYLLRTAEALISHLEKIKAKIQESSQISDDGEAKMVAEIDAQITEINIIKAEIEAATTKEQIKEAAKKLRAKWNRLKHIARLHSERVVSARVEGLVNRGIVLEKKLDHILQKAEEKGIDADVSAEVEAFSSKIALAKDKYAQAQAKLESVLDLKAGNATNDQIKSAADEAKSLLKEARDALKEAHDILKEIVKKIKEAIPEANLSEDVEVEVEASVSAEASSDADETGELDEEASAASDAGAEATA